MTLPGNITRIHVTGNFVDLTGQPMNGTITFSVSVNALRDLAADQIIVAADYVGKVVDGVLYASDSVSDLMLPATNDPDVDIQDFTYHVVENFSPGRSRGAYDISVPIDAPGGVLDLISVVPPGSGSSPGTIQLMNYPIQEISSTEPDTTNWENNWLWLDTSTEV